MLKRVLSSSLVAGFLGKGSRLTGLLLLLLTMIPSCKEVGQVFEEGKRRAWVRKVGSLVLILSLGSLLFLIHISANVTAQQAAQQVYRELYGSDLKRQVQQEPQNILIDPTTCYLRGFVPEEGTTVKGGNRRSDRISCVIEVPGSYYFAFLMLDDEDGTEEVTLKHNGRTLGKATAYYDNGRLYFFYTAVPQQVTRGDTFELVTGNPVGYYRVAQLMLLTKIPEHHPTEITDVEVFVLPQDDLETGTRRVQISWITSRPADGVVEYGLGSLERSIPEGRGWVSNHRVVLDGLREGARYSLHISGSDGIERVSSDILSFVVKEPRISVGTVTKDIIPLAVEEPTGNPRQSWPIASGIPFSQGTLASEDHVRLLDGEGEETPAQFTVLSRWPDGSIKWLLVEFLASTNTESTSRYSLEYGNEVSPRPVEDPFVVRDTESELIVSNDKIQFTISRNQFALFNRLWLDANGNGVFSNNEQIIGPLNIGWIQIGKAYNCTPESILVEERGPIRLTVKVEGHHVPGFKKLFHCILRIHTYANEPYVKVTYTLGNDNLGQEMTDLTSVTLRTGLNLQGQRWAAVTQSLESLNSRETWSLLQDHDDHYVLSSSIGKEFTGVRAPGFAALRDNRWGLIVAIRDFWQTYPKGFQIDNDGITLELMPQLPPDLYSSPQDQQLYDRLYYWYRDGKYRLKWGIQISHDLLYYFHTAEDPMASDPAKINEAFQNSLFASASPEVYTESNALGDVDPQVEGEFDRFRDLVERGFQAMERNREDLKEYGFLNYGDWYGERTWNWGNLEYDLQWALALHFMRTGDLRYFHRGEEAAKHYGDVDTVHYASRPEEVGKVYAHSVGHTGGYFDPTHFKDLDPSFVKGLAGNLGHTWTQGNFVYYFLTGDQRYLEAAQLIADWLASYMTMDFNFGSEREAGWPLIAVISAYEATGNPFYLNAARIFARRAVKNQDPVRGVWAHPEKMFCPGYEGGITFMTGILLTGLKMYDQIEPTRGVQESIVRASRWLAYEMWDASRKCLREEECLPGVSTTKCWSVTCALVSEGLTYGYRLAGDEKFQEVVLAALGRAFRQRFDPPWLGLGKEYTILIRVPPYALYDIRRWGITQIPSP